MTDTCKVEREDGILIVTLNRESRLNTFTQNMHEALEEAWDEFFSDETLRVAILTGAGDRAFSVGSDLAAYRAGKKPRALKSGFAGITHRLGTSKPIIAAVNGLALGGGFEVMLCCDLAVASENAEFGLPEPLVGMAALGGGIPRLCRKLPFNQAMTMLLTGERISATQALHWGLVSEVVPVGESLDAARRLADRILRGAPLSIEATKQVADACLHGATYREILAMESGDLAKLIIESEDAREGIAAFLGKRQPIWHGR